ncbi:LysE family translocator [Litorivita sp. NS0012-18]|uniref:LysE family translocator n=1 Tax=Litorivita sp. NS0012-18 TaxID=3127655 RepID=UPI003105DEE9
MLDPHSFYLFLGTAVVLVLTPGPDTVLILSRTLASGTLAGLMTLLGTQAGNVIHALLAGVGVSAIVLLVPSAYAVLKAAGVVYLLYLAIQAWRASTRLDLDMPLSAQGGPRRYFVQGLVNNLANPKMIAFFIALFPQFIRPEQGAVATQSLVLGVTLAAMAVMWIGFVVLAVGRMRARIATSPAVLCMANRLAAVTFAALALRLAAQRSP